MYIYALLVSAASPCLTINDNNYNAYYYKLFQKQILCFDYAYITPCDRDTAFQIIYLASAASYVRNGLCWDFSINMDVDVIQFIIQ